MDKDKLRSLKIHQAPGGFYNTIITNTTPLKVVLPSVVILIRCNSKMITAVSIGRYVRLRDVAAAILNRDII